VNQAPASAQAGPAIAVQSESEFQAFCDSFGLRDHAFGDSDTVSSDSAYQEAWSFTLDVASSNSAKGRRADAYLSRAQSLELKMSAIEREGGDPFGFNSSLGEVNPICPPGTLFSACAIASCDLARGVTCAHPDAS
jgi:hypothetical protein